MTAISLGSQKISGEQTPLAGRVRKEITEYLKAGRKMFSHFPLDLSGLNPFTVKVLKRTSKIPFGRTLAYSGLARKVGKPLAGRAVGNALNRNPFPLLIPCHRVVAKNGGLGGFASGSKIKRRLLELEGIVAE